MSQIMNLFLRRGYKTFMTEVSLIQTFLRDKHVIKYVIVLGKDNWNGKER